MGGVLTASAACCARLPATHASPFRIDAFSFLLIAAGLPFARPDVIR
jgi:hypothetical protein